MQPERKAPLPDCDKHKYTFVVPVDVTLPLYRVQGAPTNCLCATAMLTFRHVGFSCKISYKKEYCTWKHKANCTEKSSQAIGWGG